MANQGVGRSARRFRAEIKNVFCKKGYDPPAIFSAAIPAAFADVRCSQAALLAFQRRRGASLCVWGCYFCNVARPAARRSHYRLCRYSLLFIIVYWHLGKTSAQMPQYLLPRSQYAARRATCAHLRGRHGALFFLGVQTRRHGVQLHQPAWRRAPKRKPAICRWRGGGVCNNRSRFVGGVRPFPSEENPAARTAARGIFPAHAALRWPALSRHSRRRGTEYGQCGHGVLQHRPIPEPRCRQSRFQPPLHAFRRQGLRFRVRLF